MNKSGSIFLLLLLLVALSESFPKHYLVETEGAYKKKGGKYIGSFGCVDASGKIFKDGEIFNTHDYWQFKCKCQEKKCKWLFLMDDSSLDSSEGHWCNSNIKCKDYPYLPEKDLPDTCSNCCSACYDFCMAECEKGTLMLEQPECSKICSSFE